MATPLEESLLKRLKDLPDPYFHALSKCFHLIVFAGAFYLGRFIGDASTCFCLLLPLYLLLCILKQRRGGDAASHKSLLSKKIPVTLADKGLQLPSDDLAKFFIESQAPSFNWLNGILRTFWLNYSAYSSFMLTKVFWPKIQGENVVLENLKFEDFQLGDQTPVFKSIRVFKSNADVFLDAHCDYDGNARFKIVFDAEEFCRVPVTLYNLKLRNVKLRIILKEVNHCFPFVRGLQIFLLEVPGFDWSFADAASIINLPGLDNCVKKLLRELIVKRFVWPRTLSISLKDLPIPSCPSFIPRCSLLEDVHVPRPEGIVNLTVKRAESLRLIDRKGIPSPYVHISLGSTSFETKSGGKTRHPVFNETFEFPVEYLLGRTMELHVLHDPRHLSNKISFNSVSLGRVTEKLENVRLLRRLASWYNLEMTEGRIFLLFRWIPLTYESKIGGSGGGALCIFVTKVFAPGLTLTPVVLLSLLRGQEVLEERESLSPLGKSSVSTINEGFIFRMKFMEKERLRIGLRVNKASYYASQIYSFDSLRDSKISVNIPIHAGNEVSLTFFSRIMFDSHENKKGDL